MEFHQTDAKVGFREAVSLIQPFTQLGIGFRVLPITAPVIDPAIHTACTLPVVLVLVLVLTLNPKLPRSSHVKQ